jgi:hypothetical protein
MNGPSATKGGCDLCGRSPSQYFTYEQITGLLLLSRATTINKYLCRQCSRRVGRTMQSATLLTGWWGVRAVFRNVIAVVTNTSGLIKAMMMPPPVGGPISSDDARSVFGRPQTWIGLAILGSIVWIAVTSA